MKRWWMILFLVCLVQAPVTAAPFMIGHQKQVFLDGLFVARADGVQLVVHWSQKTGGLLLSADQPYFVWTDSPR